MRCREKKRHQLEVLVSRVNNLKASVEFLKKRNLTMKKKVGEALPTVANISNNEQVVDESKVGLKQCKNKKIVTVSGQENKQNCIPTVHRNHEKAVGTILRDTFETLRYPASHQCLPQSNLSSSPNFYRDSTGGSHPIKLTIQKTGLRHKKMNEISIYEDKYDTHTDVHRKYDESNRFGIQNQPRLRNPNVSVYQECFRNHFSSRCGASNLRTSADRGTACVFNSDTNQCNNRTEFVKTRPTSFNALQGYQRHVNQHQPAHLPSQRADNFDARYLAKNGYYYQSQSHLQQYQAHFYNQSTQQHLNSTTPYSGIANTIPVYSKIGFPGKNNDIIASNPQNKLATGAEHLLRLLRCCQSKTTSHLRSNGGVTT